MCVDLVQVAVKKQKQHDYWESKAMTLTEILSAIRQLAVADKVELMRILASELETSDDIYPLEPHKTYYLETPYDNFGVGEVLMQAMNNKH